MANKLRDDIQELDYKIDDKLDADEYDFDDFVRGKSLNDLIRDELEAIENEKGDDDQNKKSSDPEDNSDNDNRNKKMISLVKKTRKKVIQMTKMKNLQMKKI